MNYKKWLKNPFVFISAILAVLVTLTAVCIVKFYKVDDISELETILLDDVNIDQKNSLTPEEILQEYKQKSQSFWLGFCIAKKCFQDEMIDIHDREFSRYSNEFSRNDFLKGCSYLLENINDKAFLEALFQIFRNDYIYKINKHEEKCVSDWLKNLNETKNEYFYELIHGQVHYTTDNKKLTKKINYILDDWKNQKLESKEISFDNLDCKYFKVSFINPLDVNDIGETILLTPEELSRLFFSCIRNEENNNIVKEKEILSRNIVNELLNFTNSSITLYVRVPHESITRVMIKIDILENNVVNSVDEIKNSDNKSEYQNNDNQIQEDTSSIQKDEIVIEKDNDKIDNLESANL